MKSKRITTQLVVASLFLASAYFCFHASSQIPCPDGASITANDKCVFLSWDSPPVPLPDSVDVNGVTYFFEEGDGTESDLAIYRDSAPGGGACNAGQSNLFSGDLSFDGGEPCSFIEGSLGVEWLTVKARESKNIVEIQWTVIADEYNDFFEVERSKNGINWQQLKRIENISVFEIENYSYEDRNPLVGTNYYRISQTDLSGQKSYSEIVIINLSGFSDLRIYTSNKTIVINGDDQALYTEGKAFLSNLSGQRIYEWPISEGENRFGLDGISYTPGLYLFTISNQSSIITEKILIQ